MRIKQVYWLFCIDKKWLRFLTPEYYKNCYLVAEIAQPLIDKWCLESPPSLGDRFYLDLPSTSWSHSAQRLIFESDYES